MNLIADDVFVACLVHLDEVNHAVVESNQDLLGGLVVGQTDGLLRVPLGPNLDKPGGL